MGWQHTNLPESHSCATYLPLFIFNPDTYISLLSPGSVRTIVSQTLYAWIHVFGSACARGCVLGSVSLCDCIMPIYVSATSFTTRQIEGSFTIKPPVCVLPQIMSDVTSLRTVYMCEIQRRLNSLYWPCECVRKLPECIPHRHAASSVDGTLVWAAGKRLTRGGKKRGLDLEHSESCSFLLFLNPNAARSVSAPGLRAPTHRDYTYKKWPLRWLI